MRKPLGVIFDLGDTVTLDIARGLGNLLKQIVKQNERHKS